MDNMAKYLYSYKNQLLTVRELDKFSKVGIKLLRQRSANGMDYRRAMRMPERGTFYYYVTPNIGNTVLADLSLYTKHTLNLRTTIPITVEYQYSDVLPMTKKAFKSRCRAFPKGNIDSTEVAGMITSYIIMMPDGFILEAKIQPLIP